LLLAITRYAVAVCPPGATVVPGLTNGNPSRQSGHSSGAKVAMSVW
jgi:hypothetical protein